LRTAAIWVYNSVIEPVVHFFEALPGRITTALGPITETIWANLKGAASWVYQTVIVPTLDYFRNLPGRILSALGDMGTLLVNVGKAVMEGFLHGIEAGFNDVKNFINGIGGWLVAHKGPISADSTLLTPHGIAIMQGLATGLRSGFNSAVAPTLANITSGLTGNLSGSLSLGAAGGIGRVAASPSAGGGTTILQVTTPIQINGQTIAQTVTQYQLRNARSQGNAFGQWAGGSQTSTATGINTNAISR
jgi:phage-related protein